MKQTVKITTPVGTVTLSSESHYSQNNTINLDNVGNSTCELYFSLISVNLVMNINKILGDNYQIYEK